MTDPDARGVHRVHVHPPLTDVGEGPEVKPQVRHTTNLPYARTPFGGGVHVHPCTPPCADRAESGGRRFPLTVGATADDLVWIAQQPIPAIRRQRDLARRLLEVAPEQEADQ